MKCHSVDQLFDRDFAPFVKMDIFKIESTSLNTNLQNSVVDNAADQIPEVSFDGGPEFNLNFFDNPDDSNTQGGFSDPGSVESTSIGSPPPVKQQPPATLPPNGSAVSVVLQQQQQPKSQRQPFKNNAATVDKIESSFQICQPPALVNVKCGKFQ